MPLIHLPAAEPASTLREPILSLAVQTGTDTLVLSSFRGGREGDFYILRIEITSEGSYGSVSLREQANAVGRFFERLVAAKMDAHRINYIDFDPVTYQNQIQRRMVGILWAVRAADLKNPTEADEMAVFNKSLLEFRVFRDFDEVLRKYGKRIRAISISGDFLPPSREMKFPLPFKVVLSLAPLASKPRS